VHVLLFWIRSQQGRGKEMVRKNDAIASLKWTIFTYSGAYKLAIVIKTFSTLFVPERRSLVASASYINNKCMSNEFYKKRRSLK